MATADDTTERIRRTLINDAEFQPDLIERDYRFALKKTIPLAAFAYRPLDARSACLGVVTADASHQEISAYRDLAAPLLLIENSQAFDLWRVGSTPERDQRVESNLSIDGLGKYFREHRDGLRPMRLYEAKTVARIDHDQKQRSFSWNLVDPDLLPIVENRIGETLTTSVVSGIRSVVEKFGPDDWIIKAVFRLLAGKILKDKSVPGFKSATLSNIEELLEKVERHYGSQYPLTLSKKKIASLEYVMKELQSLGDLRNLTTESLGDVYERALITPDIRKIHGTHKTPGYLVDYIVWQLSEWIEQIPERELRFFEPGCGHAPFLVSAMRLLRTFDRPIPDLSRFVRERFTGIDNDSFALEIARLSLTVADEPNANGWGGLTEADMYVDGILEKAASTATVMLTNPPYEGRRAEELLWRTLPQLPIGAVFGAVVPATLLFSDKKRAVELRTWMIERCQLAEIDLFPDGLFTFGDHECALVAGRVLPPTTPTKSLQTRLRRVPDNDSGRSTFLADYQFGTTRLFAQSDFARHEDHSLWIAEFQYEIWRYLEHLNPLSSIATVNQGLQHKGLGLPKNAKTVEDKPFAGSVEGFASSSGDWGIHETPEVKYFNLAEEVIRRPGTGTDRVPQVLLNYGPVGRGCWRLKPFVDEKGRVLTSRFLSVRSLTDADHFAIWALLASPIANLFAFTHLLKRDVTKGVIERLPVPVLSELQRTRLSKMANQYIKHMRLGRRDMFSTNGYTESSTRESLLLLDAEVLRCYQLPIKAERLLLEQFRGEQRPGVPVPFTEYYPADTPDVPLYAFLSKTYQGALRGNSPELSEQELARYNALCEKADAGKLTPREAERLYELQAEVDGRDYWMKYGGKRRAPVVASPNLSEFEIRLRALSDRAATASILRGNKR